MEVAQANPDSWAVGFLDECWWSRLALPTLNSWSEQGKPLRLLQKSVAKDDPEPKAISCYGLYVPQLDQTWIRFVDGRPISSITTQFLSWSLQKLQAAGKKVMVLIWDNASWHISKEVRRWLGRHNRHVKESGEGVRIVSCLLPKHSPWLNAIEPKWIHGASEKWSSPTAMIRWALTSSPRGFVVSSIVRITSICPLPKMLPDHALEAASA
jgi:transposase